MQELEKLVVEWAEVRGIFTKSNAKTQLLKTMEELGELSKATLKEDMDGIVDGVGDVLVTLIIFCSMYGVSIKECLGVAYAEIAGRKGLMVNGVFVKEGDQA